jgi:hypothetical protein
MTESYVPFNLFRSVVFQTLLRGGLIFVPEMIASQHMDHSGGRFGVCLRNLLCCSNGPRGGNTFDPCIPPQREPAIGSFGVEIRAELLHETDEK